MRKNIYFLLVFFIFSSVLLSQVPTSPILVEPPKEASVVPINPVLTWNAVPNADCYFIHITTDTTLTPPPEYCMKTTPSYEVPANTLLPNTVYYWTVKAHNLNGWGSFSPYSSFRTIANTIEGSINNLIDQVSSLPPSGELNTNQANILVNRLEQAVHQLELDNQLVAILNLALFKLRVYILRVSGMISVGDATSLNYSADGVIDLIQTVSPQGLANTEIKPAREFELQQNYPNPFNPVTTIEYSIPDNSVVTIKVYDMLGKEVATIINKYQEYGSYIVTWNASNLSSGTYIYKLTAGNYSESKKMILNK
jgi:hypothetical protein